MRIRVRLILFVLISVCVDLKSQCNLIVDAGEDQFVCNPGETVQLNGILTGNFIDFSWEPVNGLSNPNILNPTVQINSTITYTLIGRQVSNVNLITNGDFSAGNILFSSDYTYVNPGPNALVPEGLYTISTNPNISHGNFSACGDHTTGNGNMMVINGSPVSNQDFWCQDVSVTPNTDYYFSFWLASVISSSPAELQVSINGSPVGMPFNATSTLCQWQQFFAVWNSGPLSVASICIFNLNTAASGNDFALDDLEMYELCEVEDTVTVDFADPHAEILTPITLSCIDPTIILDGSLSWSNGGPIIAYQWTTSNGTIESGANTPYPEISSAGEYILQVMDINGCIDGNIVSVTGNTIPPDLIMAADTLTCQQDSVMIISSSSQSNLLYGWLGPNGFGSSSPNPYVTQGGFYQLTITNEFNCSTVGVIEIIDDLQLPVIDISGEELNCINLETELTVISLDSLVSFNWEGPNGFSSTAMNPEVQDSGTYHLTVIAENGCSVDSEIIISASLNPAEVSILGEDLNCLTDSTDLIPVSSDSIINFLWTGPQGFVSDSMIVNVINAGLYSLETTNSNGCITSDSFLVTIDTISPSYSIIPDSLSCFNDSIQIVVEGLDSTDMIDWQGPNSFSSEISNPVISEGGWYFFEMTGLNFCVSQDSLFIQSDTLPPDISLITFDSLNCKIDSLQIITNSEDSVFSYVWTGPNGFISNLESPYVNAPGFYSVSAIGSNGCQADSQIEIFEDFSTSVISAVGGIINCQKPTFQLQGISDLVNVEYYWTGPGNFNSAEQNPWVGEEGMYSLEVTGTNGCSVSTIAEITGDFEEPQFLLEVNDSLSCLKDSVQINLSSQNSNLSYTWTGPSGFESSSASPYVFETGSYNVTVTGANGCETEQDILVFENILTPEISAVGGTISCQNPEIQIQGNSDDPNVSFQWSGPGGFNSTSQNPLVNNSGIYTLEVTANNGCSVMTNTEVFGDFDSPLSTIVVQDSLSCLVDSLQIFIITQETGLIYEWVGPSGFQSLEESPYVSEPGIYYVDVTGSNGCMTQMSVEVNQDISAPTISALGGIIDCQNPTLQLLASSDPMNSQFNWSGPGGFSSTEQNPWVLEQGNYILEVTGTNGCTASTSAEIIGDFENPQFLLEVNDTLSCLNDSVQIILTSQNSDLNYAWKGPSGFESSSASPYVFETGLYSVTVTGENGCKTEQDISVFENILTPEISATGGTINCQNPEIQIQGITDDPNVSFEWSGPGGFNSTSQNPLVSNSGIYTLEITASNGCSVMTNTEVFGDFASPVATLEVQDILSCLVDSLQIFMITQETGLIYEWIGPSGFQSFEESPYVREPGIYHVNVTGSNGCLTQLSIEVKQDISVPLVSAVGGIINCQSPTLQLQGISSDPNVDYYWTGPDGFISTDQLTTISQGGIYVLQATSLNGCSSIASTEVFEDFNPPNYSLDADTLTCAITTTEIMVIDSDENWQYIWTGPEEFNSTEQNPLISVPGIYELLATGLNGCDTTQSITIISDIAIPDLQTLGGSLDCANPVATLQAYSGTNGISYYWEGPDGFESASNEIVIQEGGDYIVTVIAPNDCKSSDTLIVESDFRIPLIDLSAGNLDCAHSEIKINLSSDIELNSVQWTGPGGFFSQEMNPVIVTPGNYHVSVSALQNDCVNLDSIQVLLIDNAPSGLILDIVQADCDMPFGEIIIEEVIGGEGLYSFSINGGESFQENPVIDGLDPGTHSIIVKDENDCTYEETFEIPEWQEPILSLPPSLTLEYCESQQIIASLNLPYESISQIFWEPSDFLSCSSCLDPFVSTLSDQIYTLTVIDEFGCEVSASIYIDVHFNDAIYIANVFTPFNQDFINDRFFIQSANNTVKEVISLEIYNRWGERVFLNEHFQANDPEEGWDGVYNGENQNPAVFVYLTLIEFKNGERKHFKGDVTLLH